jgi:preprotein translocase subunit SecG
MAKKYSINVEDGEVVSVEVDGVEYANPDQIPDGEDRAQIELLMSRSTGEDSDQAFDKEFDRQFEEDSRALEKQSERFPRIILALFLGISVLMLAIAAISAVSTVRALSRETTAPGRVVELVAWRDQAGKVFYYPVVEFYLPDESRQTIQLSEGSTTPAYDQGAPVTILYDPARPGAARVKSAANAWLAWTLTIITGVLGAAFLVAALFARSFLKPEPAAAQQG